jgi:hypothetical protein
MKRRRFVGSGVAAAGAALIPATGGLVAKSRAATGKQGARQPGAPSSSTRSGG